MSDDGHGSSGGDHADHHHEAFDAEPATELSPGEPESPLWLPVLGLAFFAAVGVWWSLGDDEASAAGASGATASAAASVAPPTPARRPAAAPRGTARPGAGAPGLGRVEAKKLDPEAIEKLRQRLREARDKGEQ